VEAGPNTEAGFAVQLTGADPRRRH
jgi:hypothetical protein